MKGTVKSPECVESRARTNSWGANDGQLVARVPHRRGIVWG